MLRFERIRSLKFIDSTFYTLLFLGALICFTPSRTVAYDNDTHFWLTYYLAVKAGYTKVQATQIASLTVSVDFDKDTEPVMPRLKLIDYFHPLSKQQWVRHYFHALPRRSTVWCHVREDSALFSEIRENERYYWKPTRETIPALKAIEKKMVEGQRDFLWNEAFKIKNPGVFLHFQQDSHAHRDFNSWVGHAGYYYIDFLDSDREKAVAMALESFEFLKLYRRQAMNDNSSGAATEAEKDEIKQIVLRFCEANKSPGYRENVLVENWNALTDAERKKYRFPPNPYWLAFGLIPQISPAPNSRSARAVVQDIFGYNNDQTPHIWKYDLDETGVPGQNKAKTAFEYHPDPPAISADKTFTYTDERANYQLRVIRGNGKERQCLPFALVDDSLGDVPKCKNFKSNVFKINPPDNRPSKYVECSIKYD